MPIRTCATAPKFARIGHPRSQEDGEIARRSGGDPTPSPTQFSAQVNLVSSAGADLHFWDGGDPARYFNGGGVLAMALLLRTGSPEHAEQRTCRHPQSYVLGKFI